MKSRILMWIAEMSLFTPLAMPVRVVAQEVQQQGEHLQRYTVTDLGTLGGGRFSQSFFINKNGVVSGSASLPDGTQHAVLWVRGQIADLRTLGGPNSIAFADNASSEAVGESETSVSDSNGEDFCGFGTHLTCLPFVWQRGVMTPLSTLGGNNGEANAINILGEVAGAAENTTPDPKCPAPQVLHFKPVTWEEGNIHALPTFRGDPDGVAEEINDRGQVVGGSGTCATFNPNLLTNLLSRHALLWENRRVTDLGNLGGTTGQAGGNLAFNLNNRGHVVGVSDLPGDTTFHAFLWTKATGMQDLGTLSGDVASTSTGINDAGLVVGLSLDASFNPRAFLWEKGAMTDLNTLIPADSPLFLMTACSINSRGKISGLGVTSTGDVHAYRATPTRSEGGTETAPAEQGGSGESPKVTLPEKVRELPQQRPRYGRFGVRLMGPQ
jgi:probable HAF family extracellular repeat protein